MIFITGAAGFIGSNIVAELAESGCNDIVCCDYWGSANKWKNVAPHFIADFISPPQLKDFLQRSSHKLRAVIHMGALSATTETDVDKLISENVCLTTDLWDFCAENRVPFIYASSAATYGSLETGLIDNESLEFLSKLRPLNAYGWSKLVTDRILMQRVCNGDPTPPQWCGLKFFNVYGPNEYHKGEMRSVVSKFFNDVRLQKPIRLFKSHRDGIEDGAQSRDFVYVKDCTAVVNWLLKNPAVSGLFNVGSGQSTSFVELISAIAHSLNVPVEFDFVPMPDHLRDKYQYFTQADISKLRLAGYNSPFSSVLQGVSDYVINYLNTNSPYR